MSDGNKAVFLSYASQDGEAAKKICEALRAAGVEVWFDQSELVGGDAWDQKIRKQIKDCALLIPVISANTQSRAEGYFRLEWRLADQRTHLMGRGRMFLLPVCIDSTKDADADVPDSFSAVQWTRLPGGETPAAFAARVKRLLTPEVETGRPRPAERDGGVTSPAKSKRTPPWLIPTVAVLAVIVGLAAWQPWRLPAVPPTKSAGEVIVQPAPASAPVFPQDPELRRAWNLIFNALNAEDFALAEEIVKAAVERHPADPETVIVYAWLNDSYINRGFDLSEERFVLGKRYADRAVKLAPNDPEALAALGQFLSFRNADLPRAEQLLRHAIELNPREPRFYRALAHNVLGFSRPAEGLLFSEHVAELFPQDALAHYELALAYRDADRVNDMERAFDQCLALVPIAGAMIWKAWIVGWMHGDVPGMKSLLDRLPADSRLTDRAVIVRYQYSILSQQPAEVADALRTLQAFPGPTLRDFFFTGPKALLIGDLYAAQGKMELAKGQYEVALAEIDRDKVSAPADYGVLTAEYWTLLGLGRRDEALATVRLVIGSRSPEFRQRFYRWWFSTVPALLLLGGRELALEEIKQLAASAGRSQLRMAFRIDPRVAAFRDDAEIMALIAEPGKATAPNP